jgi:hypothetical protein
MKTKYRYFHLWRKIMSGLRVKMNQLKIIVQFVHWLSHNIQHFPVKNEQSSVDKKKLNQIITSTCKLTNRVRHQHIQLRSINSISQYFIGVSVKVSMSMSVSCPVSVLNRQYNHPKRHAKLSHSSNFVSFSFMHHTIESINPETKSVF